MRKPHCSNGTANKQMERGTASSLNRKVWEVGNVAAIPLSDGTFGLAQVVSLEPRIKRAVTIAYFDVLRPTTFATSWRRHLRTTSSRFSLPRDELSPGEPGACYVRGESSRRT